MCLERSLLKHFDEIYNLISDRNNLPDKIITNKILLPYLEFFCQRKNIQVEVEDFCFSKHQTIEKSNKILIAFSGGKDSFASIIKSLNSGFIPVLFYVHKINKGYYNEYRVAKNLAQDMNLEFFEFNFENYKTTWREHPFKNQMILLRMVEYGLSKGITNFLFGNFSLETLQITDIEESFSDSIELFVEFNKVLKQYCESIDLYQAVQCDLDSFQILEEHFGYVNKIQSCLMPDYRKPNLRKNNIKKFEIDLFENRCGSCWKCAMEYIYFYHKNKVKKNTDYYNKCLEKYWKFEDTNGLWHMIIDTKNQLKNEQFSKHLVKISD